MSENILEVKGLTKDYGDFVLDKLTFTVPKGVIMGLIGENGAGKSTTINCILNEISKTDGNIEIFGKDYLSEEIEIKDKIGVVFDENHFPDIFTPNEIGTYMSGIYSKWERNTYVNYLSKFELPADKRVKDCAVKIEGAGYGIVLSSDENKLFGGRIGKPKVAICPECGEVSIYLEDLDRLN